MATNRETYLATFDELHTLGTSLYADYTQGKKTKEEVVDQCESIFLYAYLLGYRIGIDDLDIEEDEAIYYLDSLNNSNNAQESVNRPFLEDGVEKTFRECLEEHLDNLDGETSIEKVLNTEWHRNINSGIQQLATDYVETNSSSAQTTPYVYKTWRTELDNKVRDTHSYLEGMKVGVNDEFYTYNGDHAMYPGMFDNASEDVNCRCTVHLSKE